MTLRGIFLCLLAGVLAAGAILYALVFLAVVIGVTHGA